MDKINAIIAKMNIVERKDGRLSGRITYNGNRKEFYGATKAEIKRKAREYCTKVENGYFDPERVKLSECIEDWLHKYKWNKVSDSTYTRMYRTYHNQIKDTIGQMQIGNVTSEVIQNLINEYAGVKDDHSATDDDTAENTKKSLARSGLKKIMSLLNEFFEQAVKDGKVCVNPCDAVVIPKEEMLAVKTKEQISLTDTQIEDIKNVALTKCKNGKYKYQYNFVILLILNLGLRAGEMLALMWSDIDFERKIVYIRRTMQNNVMLTYNDIHNHVTRVGDTTKTKAGRRVLKLNDTVVEYLLQIKQFQEEHGIVSDFICATTKNHIITLRQLERQVVRFAQLAEIKEHITLHTLRHTFGSYMLRHGTPIEVVSKLMGHANVKVTYDKYIHVLQEQEALAMNTVIIA